MPGQMLYHAILKVLKEQYDKDPHVPVSSGELRAELNTPLEELLPYVDKLVENGYVFKARGRRSEGASFLIKIREKGLKAVGGRKINIPKP